MKVTRVLLIVLALIVSNIPIAYALPRNESDIEYYSDDTFTEMVGEKFHGCDGSRYTWGEVTSYEHSYGSSCESYGGWDCWEICDFNIATGQETCWIISCGYW